MLLMKPAIPEIYPLSLHDALPIWLRSHGSGYPGRSGRDFAREGQRSRGSHDRWSQSRGRLSGTYRDGRISIERRSEEHTSELQSQFHLVCRLLLEKKNLWKKI